MATANILSLVVFALFGLLLAVMIYRVFTRRGRAAIGPAAIGSVYDLLNKDKRNAVEIIIEERTGERDPEDADGNLPDLTGKPKSSRPKSN